MQDTGFQQISVRLPLKIRQQASQSTNQSWFSKISFIFRAFSK